MKLKTPKVFGIGFHKTATTSLAVALERLGYKVTGPNGIDNPDIGREVWPMALHLAKDHDAFQDNPWPLLYRQLDEEFPGSKFILTFRPSDEWLRSIVRHFGNEETPMRKWIYGVGHPAGNEDIYLARYQQHNHEVAEYFKDRPGDLLFLNITAAEGWEKLCPFLELPIPTTPFPQTNTAQQRESKRKSISKFIKSITRRS